MPLGGVFWGDGTWLTGPLTGLAIRLALCIGLTNRGQVTRNKWSRSCTTTTKLSQPAKDHAISRITAAWE
jgi:hypothetical protein